jgi:rfaE bifunctional protein nucleotidyltransferase chain/domain
MPRVVFTNGCFDLLHPGHLHLLQQAARLGEWLLVGLNSDRSVRELKGPGRPLVTARERRAMLLALRCVNEVVIFDAPTPRELLARRRPSILVKGAGSPPTDGAEFCRSVGYVELLPGWSTTDTIARLRRA